MADDPTDEHLEKLEESQLAELEKELRSIKEEAESGLIRIYALKLRRCLKILEGF